MDSLRSDSSEESCSEDLDTEQDTTPSSPPLPSFTCPPAGIVLEFGNLLHDSHPESNPNVRHRPVRTVDPSKASDTLSSGHPKDSDNTAPNMGGTSELQRSAKSTATRSLSAAVRKKSLSHDEDLSSTQEVLEAVLAENEMVGGASQVEIDSVEGSNQKLNTIITPSLGDCEAGPYQVDSNDEIEASEQGRPISVSTSPPSEKSNKASSKRLSFPLKPVLLSYNMSKPSKYHVRPPPQSLLKPAPGHAPSTLLDQSEEVGTSENIASHSLTEHTLKVITEKVRNMNSK